MTPIELLNACYGMHVPYIDTDSVAIDLKVPTRKKEVVPTKAYIDKKHKKFVLEFSDGTKETSMWEDTEYFDHYIAFALCCVKKHYGSSTKMRAALDNIFKGER